MKTPKNDNLYLPPMVEVVELLNEQGFAETGSGPKNSEPGTGFGDDF